MGRALWCPRYCRTLRPSLSCARSRSTSAASRHDDIEAALEDMTAGHGTPSVFVLRRAGVRHDSDT